MRFSYNQRGQVRKENQKEKNSVKKGRKKKTRNTKRRKVQSQLNTLQNAKINFKYQFSSDDTKV